MSPLQTSLVQHCQARGVQVVAWSPLAKLDATVLEHPVVAGLATKHGVSSTAIVLRWNVQRGVVVIPRSGSSAHIAENLEATTGPVLSAADMEQMGTMDSGTRLTRDWVCVFEGTALLPYGMIGHTLSLLASVLWLFVPHVLDFKMHQRSVWELLLPMTTVGWLDRMRLVGLGMLLASVGAGLFL